MDNDNLAVIVSKTDRRKRLKKKLLKWLKILIIIVFVTACILLIILFVVIPLIFMYSIELERLAMFTNFNLPTDPEYFKSFENQGGLNNFYITVENEDEGTMVSLGVWHFLPEPLLDETVHNRKNYQKSLRNSSFSVLLYFHGSGETRADLLKKCYKLRLNFHVIIFDYRDYADSSAAKLSENAIVEDSIGLYNWLRSMTNSSIYVWGHSLGSSLSSNTVAHLKKKGIVPHGLILESPLPSMRKEIPHHPYGKIFAWLPWFEATIINPLEKNGFNFNTMKYILNVECPIMILHAEDDSIIPYTLGEELYFYAVTQRNISYGSVNFHLYSSKYEHDHFFIYEDEQFNAHITEFMQDCDNYARKRM